MKISYIYRGHFHIFVPFENKLYIFWEKKVIYMAHFQMHRSYFHTGRKGRPGRESVNV